MAETPRITLDVVRGVAALARLRLREDEELLYSEQLTRIVEYIGQLEGYETLEETASPLPGGEAEDVALSEAEREVTQDAILNNAPESLDTFVVVPQVKVTGDD